MTRLYIHKVVRILRVCWLLLYSVTMHAQDLDINYQDILIPTDNNLNFEHWRHVNNELIIGTWMNNQQSTKSDGYFCLDNRLAADENIYLLYNYEMDRMKAEFGFSINHNSIFSVKINQSFSLTHLFKK